MTATVSLTSETYLGHNQATYQELRLALQLNLRRQLLIAVCDDGALQTQLAQRLEANFSPLPATVPVAPEVRARQISLVTLGLNGDRPDLVREILLWLKQQHHSEGNLPPMPILQIVGIDQLTRQSPTVQNRFLASLVRVDALLTQLDCRLVVWVPRPWLGKIRQSVPGFWRSRSGLFEFVGEPTPHPVPPPAQDSLDQISPREPEGDTVVLPPSPGASEPAPMEAAPDPEPTLPPELAEDAQIANLWRYIQGLIAQQAGPLTLARAYLTLGQLGRDRLVAEPPTASGLDFAIAAYNQAIAGLPEGTADWCDALNDLASLYWIQGQQIDTADPGPWLRRSVQTYEKALQGRPNTLATDTLGRIYSNLGTVYGLLADLEDPVPCLLGAVAAYGHALEHHTAERSPLDYATLQNSLGAIHWRLAQHERPQHHLPLAIAAYSAALPHRPAAEAPLEYAMIQNNLGIAYWSLAQHQQPMFLLERAIVAYQAALAHRTLAAAPAGCAATANNLGTAYWDLAQQATLPSDRRLSVLEEAVAAYETALTAAATALQITPPPTLGFDLWATCHSAGVVHDQIAQALPANKTELRQRHLDTALGHYLVTYQGWQDHTAQRQVLITALVYNLRLSFEIFGIAGQQAALSQVPGELLPEILRQL